MKTFNEKIIFTFLFAVLASTGHLLAQDENRLKTTNQITGYRLQGLSREQGTGNRQQVPNNRESESLLEDQIGLGAEIATNYEPRTTNCNNSSENLNCYLMMNPAMVEETEEAVEKFIIGEAEPPRGKYSVNPSVECALTNHEDSPNSASSSKSPFPAAAAASPTSHLSPPTTIRPISRIVTASVLGLGAFCSMLPQTMAQPTIQPTIQPTSAPNEAFVIYSGSDSVLNEQISPRSILTNPDGSYIIGGCSGFGCDNSLLGKVNANGQQEWFYQQSISSNSIHVLSTTIMNNELYSAGRNGESLYISKSNLTNGDLLSAWGSANVPFELITILPTSQNTLIAFTGNYGWEFNPYNSTVLSVVNISSDYSIQTAAAINNSSYVVGGIYSKIGAPNAAFLSQISLVDTNWSSDWTCLYSNAGGVNINSVAARNNTVIFGGSMNGEGFIGSVDATKGTNYWSTSLEGGGQSVEDSFFTSVIFASSDLNNTNQIMAGGCFNNDAWYALMNLNNGTLSQSVILEASSLDNIGVEGLVANDDGTFTSVGYISEGSVCNLMFVTLNENLEINPNLLPSEIDCTSNNNNIVIGAQNVTTSMSDLRFSPSSLNLTDITSQFSTVTNNPITQSFPPLTAQPTKQPTFPPSGSSKSSSSSSIIIGGSAGGAVIMAGALYAAYRKMMGRYLKEAGSRSTMFEGDVEQSFVLPRPFGSFSREAAISSSTVQAPSILSDNNISIEEAADIKDRPSDLVTDQPPAQYTEQVSPMH